MYFRVLHSILLFFCCILNFANSNSPITLSSCCRDRQTFFSNGTCESKVKSLGPKKPLNLSWMVENTLANVTLLPTNFEFECSTEEISAVVITNDTKSTASLTNNGQLYLGDVVLSNSAFCANRIAKKDLSFMSIAFCKNALQQTIPKCCPLGHSSMWLHPEICIPRNEDNENGGFNDKAINFVLNPINCVSKGRMVGTLKISEKDLSYSTIQGILEYRNRSESSFCVERVLTSHTVNFNFSKDFGLFFCDREWPYEEFSINGIEKKLYGICLLLSAIFLMFAIIVYVVMLKKTHCQVHTWIELFYMISLLSLAIFCILLIDFPERNESFCSLYHLFSVLGYFTSAVSVFGWATILSVELYFAFKDLRPPTLYGIQQNCKRLILYIIFGFSLPALASSVVFWQSFDWEKSGYCIDIEVPAMRLVLGALIAVNLASCLATLCLILKHRKLTVAAVAIGRRHGARTRKRLNELISCFIKLYLICGLTFGGVIIGYFTGTVRSSAWYYVVYRAFISLRGVTVFFIFVCNRKTKLLIMQCFRKERLLRCLFHAKPIQNLQSVSTLRNSETT